MSRRHRRRRRYGRRASAGQTAAAAVVAGVVLAGAARGPATVRHAAARPAPKAVAAVVAYARAQLGKPYRWGGTGPGGYDCSGLAMEALRAAGIAVPRTSAQQWARGPRVNRPEPGDLVFFAGADGTRARPGHVGIVIGPHVMIDAYGTGYGVETDTFGRPGDAARGLADPAGFTDPLAPARGS